MRIVARVGVQEARAKRRALQQLRAPRSERHTRHHATPRAPARTENASSTSASTDDDAASAPPRVVVVAAVAAAAGGALLAGDLLHRRRRSGIDADSRRGAHSNLPTTTHSLSSSAFFALPRAFSGVAGGVAWAATADGRLAFATSSFDDDDDDDDEDASAFDEEASAFDEIASAFDEEVSTFDKVVSTFDEVVSAFDKVASTFDKVASAFDEEASTFAKVASAFDKVASAFVASAFGVDATSTTASIGVVAASIGVATSVWSPGGTVVGATDAVGAGAADLSRLAFLALPGASATVGTGIVDTPPSGEAVSATPGAAGAGTASEAKRT